MIKSRVTLDEATHTYTDEYGVVYNSITRMLGNFKPPFDRDLIAEKTAGKRDRISKEEAKKTGVSQETILRGYPPFSRGITKEHVVAEWQAKLDRANAKGDQIHKGMEIMAKTGVIIEDEFTHYYVEMQKFIAFYSKVHPELIIDYPEYETAGMADLPVERTNSKKSVVDIYDYKTNVINHDSLHTDFYTKKKSYRNDFMLFPMDHLEICHYNSYALQLSAYAFMLEEAHGKRIGKLAIVNVPWENPIEKPKIIYVPYMKYEIKRMFDFIQELRHTNEDPIEIAVEMSKPVSEPNF